MVGTGIRGCGDPPSEHPYGASLRSIRLLGVDLHFLGIKGIHGTLGWDHLTRSLPESCSFPFQMRVGAGRKSRLRVVIQGQAWDGDSSCTGNPSDA